MEPVEPGLDMPVAEVMRRWPRTLGVFVARQMACPGCPMAPFMTVADAAREYRLRPEELLRALAESLRR